MRLAAIIGVIVLLLLLLLVGQAPWRRTEVPADAPAASATPTITESSEIQDLEQQRNQLDDSVWRQEVEAQRYEAFIVQLWDAMRQSDQPWKQLAHLPLKSIATPEQLLPEREYQDNIQVLNTTGSQTFAAAAWPARVAEWQSRFELVQSEWHHSRFEFVAEVPQSTVSMTLHLQDTQTETRVILKGELTITWPADGTVRPDHIDATNLKAWQRRGAAQFRLAASLPATSQGATDFLAAYDLDGDGLSEILFGDRVLWNRGSGDYSMARLSPFRERPLQSAVLADFDNDGRADLLCADPREKPQVYLADPQRRFTRPPETIEAVESIANFSTAITAGDVNGDGLLDVWLTQYKPPYRQGQMPTPYFDANDGNPSYLLINDGQGGFRDETTARGLAGKRHRRTYSSSLVDWDHDGDLDLVVVSDFAGLDIHRNDNGIFHDVTEQLVDEPHNFGMSHTLADFDRDGRLDLVVCGMGSTTARRLDAMGAWRQDRDVETRMRSIMGYGNRLYLGRGDRFSQPSFANQLARTGWSWGVTAFDFNNDGFRDVYVGNGHISGSSAKDYCTQFWRHDIYTGDSSPNPALAQYFLKQQTEFQGDGSWNGYEHNCLLSNQRGLAFVETAFLFGLAHEFDTRNVVADDIDGNGFVDLLIVEHPRGAPATLHVWRNYGVQGNWIGVVLPDKPGVNLPGTRVLLRTDEGDQLAHVINGDSFNSQHAATVHFGLGDLEHVTAIEITDPQGHSRILATPEVGKYHVVK